MTIRDAPPAGGTAAARVLPSPHAPPRRLRAWLGADPGRKVAVSAAALLAAQAGLRAWVGYRGYFFLDDFAFIGRAARYSPTDLHSFLLAPYNGHLMPGAFVEVWGLTKLWPLNFAVVVTVNLALQLLIGIVFYRLLRELFGTRPAILFPFAVFLFTPITLSAFIWWAAALNQLPQQLAMVTALWCQTRYLRTARVRVGICGALATAAGLLFSEKTLLTVPLIALYTVFFFAEGSLLRRTITVTRAHWRVWVAYLCVAIPYSAYYVLEVPSPGRAPARANDVLQVFGAAFGHALAPGVIGGPWRWRPIGFVGALADPTWLTIHAAAIGVMGFIIWTIAWYRRAVFGWLMAVVYATMALLLLAFSRATYIGPLIGDEYRYVTDVAAVAVLGGTLAVLRPVGSWQTAPSPVSPRAWTTRLRGRRWWDELVAAVPRVRPAVVVAVLITLFVGSAGYSTVRFDRYWNQNPAHDYVNTLRTELSLAAPNIVIYDQEVPTDVEWALLYPYNTLSSLLRPLDGHPHFLAPGHSASTLAIIDDQGHLRRVAVLGPSALPGPVTGGCGWLLDSSYPTHVHLSNRTFAWTWVLHMGYVASEDTATTVHAGRTTVRVPLRSGLHEFYLLVSGAIDTVDFTPLANHAVACTSDLQVGRAIAIPGSAP